MKYSGFDEYSFREYVNKALISARKVLDVNRNPEVAEDQDHSYDDKFAFAEFLSNTFIAAQMNLLENIGMNQDKIEKIYSMVHDDKRSVMIRFQAEDSCKFEKETIADVIQYDSEHITETVQEKSGILGGTSTKTKKDTQRHKVIQKVKESHWRVNLKYRLFCYAGNEPDKNPVELCSRTVSTIITTTGGKVCPRKEKTIHKFLETPLTWLFQNMKPGKKVWNAGFRIDRTAESCRTPRRNDQIESAFKFCTVINKFAKNVNHFFSQTVENDILGSHNPANPKPMPRNLSSMDNSSVFCPILPLFENKDNLAGTASRGENPRSLLVLPANNINSAESPILSIGDIDLFLNEQCRTIQDSFQSLESAFSSSEEKLISSFEAQIFLILTESSKLTEVYGLCINYIENMLKTQLITAIGKKVTPKDFDQFMRFHNRKLFLEQYCPKPFCYSIRRSEDHSPEGLLSIEATNTADSIDPCFTYVKHIDGENALPIKIPLNAATQVQISGERYLHGWMNHKFENHEPLSYQLTARARQFSSFILMIGTVAGPDTFIPKDAIIIQNKDEILIPILLNELPSAKEFKDSIASLSPEQQRFATAFRGMQLESSVFGVCVVQLKPQMEKLLGLTNDSLTKEIKLTQDLMELFSDYQIPSSLLSFDGNTQEESTRIRLDRVKENVKAVMDAIDAAKKKQLEEGKLRAERESRRAEEEDERVRRAEVRFAMVCAARSAPPPPSRKIQQAMDCFTPQDAFARGGIHSPPQAKQIFSASTRNDAANDTAETQENNHMDYADTQTITDGTIDFSMIPKQLDQIFETHDTDGSIRSTILETGINWIQIRQPDLLSNSKRSILNESGRKDGKNKAFDLLDALSRSGALPISCAELHIIVAVTHRFENDLMGTVIQDNINPIEKVEKSILMIASMIHQERSATNLLSTTDHRDRLVNSFPELLHLEN